MGAIPFKADRGDLTSFLSEQHGTSDLMGSAVPGSDLYFEATGVGAVFEQKALPTKHEHQQQVGLVY